MHKMRYQSDTKGWGRPKITRGEVILKDQGMDADFAKKISPHLSEFTSYLVTAFQN